MMSYVDDDTYRLIFEYGMADGIVDGEGEEAITEIAKILKKNPKENNVSLKTVPNLIFMEGSQLVRSDARPRIHISEYPLPHYDKRMLKKYGSVSPLGILLSRGCSWGKCAFCEFPKTYNRKQLIEPEKAADNIHRLISKYPGHPVRLQCDMMEPAYVRYLCKTIVKRGIKFQWRAFMRADAEYSLADLKLIKRSGCILVNVGIESLDTKVLSIINKGYTADQAVSFLRNLLKSGIDAEIHMIINLPGTNYRSALKQYRILKKLLENAEKGKVRHSVWPAILLVSKNAPLGICPEKYGIELTIPKHRKLSDYINYLPYLSRQSISDNEADRIVDLYRELNSSLEEMKLCKLWNRKSLYPSDRLHYQKNWIMVQDHLFDPDGKGGIHHRAPRAFARVADIQNGPSFFISNADLVRWILKKLPISLSDLRKAFRKEEPFQIDEIDLVDTLQDMISIGVLEV
jgi:radical SAM superfamily enzyme YgiQ (UPF0313 family)